MFFLQSLEDNPWDQECDGSEIKFCIIFKLFSLLINKDLRLRVQGKRNIFLKCYGRDIVYQLLALNVSCSTMYPRTQLTGFRCGGSGFQKSIITTQL